MTTAIKNPPADLSDRQASPAGPPPPLKPRPFLVGRILGFLALGVLAFGALIYWRTRPAGPEAKSGVERKGRAELPSVPIVPGVVTEKDVPVFLEGLGTVQAFQTVTIRSRVDGQLQKVGFTEGQDVRTGDLLAQIDPDPFRAQLDQAAAKKAQDEAQLANARLDLERYRTLLAQDNLARQAYDTQKALVTQLEAAVKADESALANARVQLAYTTINSPIDGRVGLRQIDQGNIVHANDANGLVVITQLKPISVVFTLPEQTLAQIRSHETNTPLAVAVVDRDNTSPLAEGKLSVIDNQIDTTTGTIRLKATFANEDLRLWPGQFVNTRLLLTVRRKSAVVPASVIQRGPAGAFAFVIQDDQTVEVRPVTVGQISQDEAVIESGLKPNERVVVDGQYKLQRGSRIKIVEGPGGAMDSRPARTGPGTNSVRRPRP